MNEPIIELDKISLVYYSHREHVTAINDLNLEVMPTSWLTIIGKSGSGKSSLLHIIAALQTPTKGNAKVLSQNIYNISLSKRSEFRCNHLGFIFQSFNLLSHLTAWENVAFQLIPHRCKPRHRKERALEWLEKVGLQERAHHYPSELSGGEQQRVAIARSMVHEPQIIIADEPTGNLDAYNRKLVAEILLGFVLGGKTILCATHDEYLLGPASHIVELENGNIVSNYRK